LKVSVLSMATTQNNKRRAEDGLAQRNLPFTDDIEAGYAFG
jgi:hypothetical protein